MGTLAVEVVYALPGRADLTRLELPEGATLRDALEASGVLGRHPDIDLRRNRVGVHGTPRALGEGLRNGDRVEVYRSLRLEPRAARRARAAASRTTR